MSLTELLTSVTCRPVMPSTEEITLRRTERARSAMGTPYSVIRSRSTAACFSPTSTETPCPTDWEAPGMRSRSVPRARAAPPPRAYTPLTSRAARPAIFCTTSSAIVVVPWVLCRAEGTACTALDELVDEAGLLDCVTVDPLPLGTERRARAEPRIGNRRPYGPTPA